MLRLPGGRPAHRWRPTKDPRDPATAFSARTATDPHQRETHLATAYETVAGLHNRLALTDP
ncbi:hypothetical protein ABZ458_09575, partial [Streptomyces sp. NPDC005760]